MPFPAGGVADVTARLIGQRLGEALGQTIVIENRTGASGTLGVDAATKATPDGYTLLFTTGDFITTPTLMPKVNFDPYKDLIPIVQVATAPLLLGAHAAGTHRIGQGADRAGQGQPGQDRLFVAGQRHHQPARGGMARDRGQAEIPARALSRRRAGRGRASRPATCRSAR